MSVNSSNASLYFIDPAVCSLIGTVFIVTRFSLMVPLSIFIFYLAYQRWRQQRSFKTTSHSDVFAYHVAALQLIWGLGAVVFLCGYYSGLLYMMFVGLFFYCIIFYGEIFFHILTCVERYLAVVHPVTYLGLRNARGVRIRNIGIGCCWLLCFACSYATDLFYFSFSFFLSVSTLILSLVVVSFCSLCVLRALIRPGPGEGGVDREHVDQSKQRAFFTIMAIMGVLWLGLLGLLIPRALSTSLLLKYDVSCMMEVWGTWCSLPSSLVLPLLYLHRAGKLCCCCHNRS